MKELLNSQEVKGKEFNELMRLVRGQRVIPEEPLTTQEMPDGTLLTFSDNQVLAQITGSGGGTPTPYSWQEMLTNGDGTYTVMTGGRSGTTSVNPAYERNNSVVPTSSIVVLTAGLDGEYYLSYTTSGGVATTSPVVILIEGEQGEDGLTIVGPPGPQGPAGTIASPATLTVTDTNTNTAVTPLTVQHSLSAGTAAAGFGATIETALDTTTTVGVPASAITTTWTDASTPKGQLALDVYDTALRTGIVIQANGSQAITAVGGGSPIASTSLATIAPADSYTPLVVQGHSGTQSADVLTVQQSSGTTVLSVSGSGQTTATSPADAVIPLVVQGHSGTQSADVLQVQQSSGTTVVSVSGSGQTTATSPGNGVIPLVVQGHSSGQTADVLRVQQSSGTTVVSVSGSGQTTVASPADAVIPLVVQGHSGSQSVDLLQVQKTPGGTNLVRINSGGNLITDSTTTPQFNGGADVTDGTRTVDICDGTYALNIGDGTYTVRACNPFVAALSTSDGTRVVDCSDGSEALSARASNFTVNLCPTAFGVALHATDASNRFVNLCDGSEALHATDGTETVDLCDGTYAVNAVLGSIRIASGAYHVGSSVGASATGGGGDTFVGGIFTAAGSGKITIGSTVVTGGTDGDLLTVSSGNVGQSTLSTLLIAAGGITGSF